MVWKNFSTFTERLAFFSVWNAAKHCVWKPPTVPWGSSAVITIINQYKWSPIYLWFQALPDDPSPSFQCLTGFSSLMNTECWRWPAWSLTFTGHSRMMGACYDLCESQLTGEEMRTIRGFWEDSSFQVSPHQYVRSADGIGVTHMSECSFTGSKWK